MLTWKTWEGTGKDWDECLLKFPDYNVYQSFSWGRHRESFGWQCLRIVGMNGGDVLSAAQVFARRMPMGVGFAWVPGGAVGDPEHWAGSLPRAIKKAFGFHFLYSRVNNMRVHSASESLRMKSEGWHKPEYPLQSGLSLFHTLDEKNAIDPERLSKNWSRNLKRSEKHGHAIRVWDSPDPDEMHAVYREMQDYKSLPEQFSRESLASILSQFGQQCVVVRCDDGDGKLLAFRGAVLFGRRGWDIFAATTTAGRKVYASHLAFAELMKQCARRGPNWYDMSGVDPAKNKGVYDFKKGTGAADLQYLGEWDWGSFPLLRPLANKVIKTRMPGA